MKDRLLFGTIGLLVGIIVMQWAMPSSNAGYVDHSTTGIVAMNGSLVFDQNGHAWNIDDQGWHVDAFVGPLPVPVDQVKFIHHAALITTANVAYSNVSGSWKSVGPWPGTPLANEQSTWGKVKAKFGGKDGKP